MPDILVEKGVLGAVKVCRRGKEMEAAASLFYSSLC